MSCTHFIHSFPSPKEWVRGVANVWIDAQKEASRLRAALREDRIWHPSDGRPVVEIIRDNCEKMNRHVVSYPWEVHLAFLVPVSPKLCAPVWMKSDGHLHLSELLKSALRGEREGYEWMKGLWPLPEDLP